jgi:hypothetical protein
VPIWAREITEKRRCSSSRFELPAIVREAIVWIEREREREICWKKKSKSATEDVGEHLCSFFKLRTLGHETMHHT